MIRSRFVGNLGSQTFAICKHALYVLSVAVAAGDIKISIFAMFAGNEIHKQRNIESVTKSDARWENYTNGQR
jgi:predicted peroxiredoxin